LALTEVLPLVRMIDTALGQRLQQLLGQIPAE
jgi:hypothetical protein